MGQRPRLERRRPAVRHRGRVLSRRRQGLRLDRSGPWIASGALFVLLWLSLTTATFAPWWVVVLLVLLLVPQAVLIARWSADHPRRCLGVPVVGLVLWAGVSLLAG